MIDVTESTGPISERIVSAGQIPIALVNSSYLRYQFGGETQHRERFFGSKPR